MRVIMSGGGTGGHIYPAVAIADKIKSEEPDSEILFIGTEKGMENDIVPKYGYEIRNIKATGFNRKKLLKNFKTLKNFIDSSNKVKKILSEFKPDIVIGTGGYVTGSVIREASKKGIDCYIHEQNAFPGMTNKLLEKRVKNVFLGFEEAAKYFKRPDKHIYTGNPVREIFKNFKEDHRKKLNLSESGFVILSFGGSLGASKINEETVSAAKVLRGVSDVELIIVTGKRHFDSVKSALEGFGASFEEENGYLQAGNIRIMEYADNLPEYMMASDLLISRAGALTISEIIASNKASILVPSPNVTGNHQYHNAKVLSDRGAAILMEERDLDSDKILNVILSIGSDKRKLGCIVENCTEIEKIDTAYVIYKHIKRNYGSI